MSHVKLAPTHNSDDFVRGAFHVCHGVQAVCHDRIALSCQDAEDTIIHGWLWHIRAALVFGQHLPVVVGADSPKGSVNICSTVSKHGWMCKSWTSNSQLAESRVMRT